ncbi:MAG TPA: class I tRNA ligase family protein, partial [Pseudomonadales bacterium]
VTDAYQRRYAYNIAIAAVMELCNEVGKLSNRSPQSLAVEREALETAIVMLAPIVPHICHALWQAFGHDEPVIDARWPAVDEQALVKSHIEVVVQINGKLRAKMDVAVDLDQQAALASASALDNIQTHLAGKTVRKVIWVPNKLLNIVAS